MTIIEANQEVLSFEGNGMSKTPEQEAREKIDQMLYQTGWDIQDCRDANIQARFGVAIRNFPLRSGHGFAARNLWDMKRFYTEFQILQPAAAESDSGHIRQAVSIKSRNNRILQTVSIESSDRILHKMPHSFEK